MTEPHAQPGPAGHVPHLVVAQKVTMMANQYRIHAADPDGREGPLLAFAQQKRLALKEQVTFWTDESKSTPAFSFVARQRLDVNAGHDVLDARGRQLGSFRKVFGASLLRSTWELSVPGLEAVGRERRQSVAIARRVWEFLPVVGEIPVPFLFHFDFTDTATGRPVLTSERRRSLRDRYTITVPDPRVDVRVAAAMAVALDALQSR